MNVNVELVQKLFEDSSRDGPGSERDLDNKPHSRSPDSSPIDDAIGGRLFQPFDHLNKALI
jgi:hypothetical protein